MAILVRPEKDVSTRKGSRSYDVMIHLAVAGNVAKVRMCGGMGPKTRASLREKVR